MYNLTIYNYMYEYIYNVLVNVFKQSIRGNLFGIATSEYCFLTSLDKEPRIIKFFGFVTDVKGVVRDVKEYN